MNKIQLFSRWEAHNRNQFAPADAVQKYWMEIETRHGEAHRHYHTLDHLARLFELLEPLQEQFSNPAAVWFAVWFHDIIYAPLRKDNEEKSAAFAVQGMGELGIPQAIISQTESLILRTQSHDTKGANFDALLFLDADLSILGSAPDRYDEYAQQVRQEFSMVPGILYRPGRKKVLQSFLDRDVIYRTESFRERFEAQARENLSRELLSL